MNPYEEDQDRNRVPLERTLAAMDPAARRLFDQITIDQRQHAHEVAAMLLEEAILHRLTIGIQL